MYDCMNDWLSVNAGLPMWSVSLGRDGKQQHKSTECFYFFYTGKMYNKMCNLDSRAHR